MNISIILAKGDLVLRNKIRKKKICKVQKHIFPPSLTNYQITTIHRQPPFRQSSNS